MLRRLTSRHCIIIIIIIIIKLTFPSVPDFATGKVISAIRKCRRILVTVHVTTDAMYTTIQCLQKRYRPVGEIIFFQSRFNIYCCPIGNVHHIHHHITIDSISVTMYSALGAEEFPRRDNFATCNERQTYEGYDKILPPIDNDSS